MSGCQYKHIQVYWCLRSIYPAAAFVFEQLPLMHSIKGVVNGEELLLDMWNSSGGSERWGLHASLHTLFICVFLKGENPCSETASCSTC